MKKQKNGVFWAARDLAASLAFAGNHHFILLIFATEDQGKEICNKFNKEPIVYKNCCFCTLGGFESKRLLKYEFNEQNDVKSVKEWLAPEEITGWYDLDLEKHEINHKDTMHFMMTIMQLAQNYARNEASAYGLLDSNCASWVNTLFTVAGITDEVRFEAGEFSGVDWGEEDLIPEKLFGKA